MKNEKSIERITILVSEEKKQELRKAAEEKGLTISGLIKLVVFDYLKQN